MVRGSSIERRGEKRGMEHRFDAGLDEYEVSTAPRESGTQDEPDKSRDKGEKSFENWTFLRKPSARCKGRNARQGNRDSVVPVQPRGCWVVPPERAGPSTQATDSGQF